MVWLLRLLILTFFIPQVAKSYTYLSDEYSSFKPKIINYNFPMENTVSLDYVLSDKENLIDNQFVIPVQLQHNVSFWLKVYTQINSNQVILFDKKHPQIVYEIVDFSNLLNTSRSLIVYEILRERKLKKIIKDYKFAFSKLKQKKPWKKRSVTEKKILSALKKANHYHPVSYYQKTFRSQTGQSNFVQSGIETISPYLHSMETIFNAYDIPKELVFLSLVESSFNLRAVSKVGATGVWQFMNRTGKEFLYINKSYTIDERLSPVKSTIAAALLLKRNYRLLDNWPFAITAYNYGHSKLRKINRWKNPIRQASYTFNTCKNRYRFGWAGLNYYSEFLAVLYAANYKHLFYKNKLENEQLNFTYQPLNKTQTAYNFVLNNNLSLYQFKSINPDIKNIHVRLPKGFFVAIPNKKPLINVINSRRWNKNRTKIKKFKINKVSYKQSRPVKSKMTFF